MDFFTHIAVPYLLLWAFKRPRRERAAAGIGGGAPDLDVLTMALAHFVPALYFLGHRGASHTLIGAPIHAVLVMMFFAIPALGRKWPRLKALRPTPHLLTLAVFGSLTHLLLDFVTMWGVALLWPFSFTRYTTGWFYYGVVWLVPVSIYFVLQAARGRGSDRLAKTTAIALAGLVLISGSVRLVSHPEAPEGALTQPQFLDWTWAVLEETETGWHVTYTSWGRPVADHSYQHRLPTDAPARAALAIAEQSVHYRSFLLYAGGPTLVEVGFREDSAWDVVWTDLMGQVQDDAPWAIGAFDEDRNRMRVVVTADREVRRA